MMIERMRLSARLGADGLLKLRPAFRTAIPPERWRGDAPMYAAEVLDSDGHALVRVPLSASGTCEGDSTALRGSIDMPESAARMNILHLDGSGRDPRVLASELVPKRAPELRLLAVPEGEVEGRFTLTWEAMGDPPPVRYFVDYSVGGETWQPLSLGVSEQHLTVNFDALAGGSACRISVTASNGLRSVRVESGPFKVRKKPCAAVILRPVDGEEVLPDVVFVGNGWWREEGRPETDTLAWASDAQGELGHGRQISARLKPGTHRITLYAGEGDRAGEESITIYVRSPSY